MVITLEDTRVGLI